MQLAMDITVEVTPEMLQEFQAWLGRGKAGSVALDAAWWDNQIRRAGAGNPDPAEFADFLLLGPVFSSKYEHVYDGWSAD